MKTRIDYTRISPQSLQAAVRAGCPDRVFGPRTLAARAREDARVADQRLRLLPRHAQQGRTRGRRDRATAVLARRVARDGYLHERERAALAWTEAVTLVADGHVPDDVYAEVSKYFTEQELIALTFAIVAVNSWNRLNIAFRMEAGNYRPGMFKQLFKTA